MSGTSYELRGSVAVIALDNPPLNSLGHALRIGIVEGIDRANAEAAVNAIVLIGSGKGFSGGADISEFNTPKALAEPELSTVVRIIEQSHKPVIAAVHGLAMGGGLELALGCHYRVVVAGARISLPEVKLGVLPGAGGTQRLPRLVGVEAAMNMIVSGSTVLSEKLKGSGLFDEFVEGDLLQGALAFAENVADKRPLPRVRDLQVDYPKHEAFFQFARNIVRAASKNLPAPLECVNAVAAAVAKPFEEGLRLEREAFCHLVETPESKAFRHVFFGERSAAKVPDVPYDTPTRPIKSAAVIGAGTMGGGIAMSFGNAGIPVMLLDTKQEALDRGMVTIRNVYEGSLKKGKLTPQQFEQRLGLLQPCLSYEDIGRVDIVIEAVFEDMGVKEQVFSQLDRVMRPGAILATNTSTLDVNKIAGLTARPQDMIGMHFFSPANVMKLLEVVRGDKTAKDVLATVMKLAKAIGKIAVVSGVCDGFIGNRMLEQYWRQALFMLDEGCTPQQIDRAIEKWGMAMGPFRMIDMAGNDVSWSIRKRRYVERPEMKYSRVADKLCELGRFGQKTGVGWYRYEPGRRDPIPDPAVQELIETHRQELGMTPRKIADEEIVQRLIFALVNEGAQILDEGIALRASDVDMVYLTGYGFPPHRGGPMLYADTVGLYNVLRAMKRFAANAHGDSGFWTPAPLLTRLAAEGGRLAG